MAIFIYVQLTCYLSGESVTELITIPMSCQLKSSGWGAVWCWAQLETKLCLRGAQTCVQLLLCCHDNLKPVTFKQDPGLDILKTYPHTENEVVSRHYKGIAQAKKYKNSSQGQSEILPTSNHL